MPEYIEKPGGGAALAEKKQALKPPHRFKVLLHNDHYTTMDFVVMVLEQIYRKSGEDAQRIMLNVHKNGMGVAGVYVKAIAEAKIGETHAVAKQNGFPLRCSMEPE